VDNFSLLLLIVFTGISFIVGRGMGFQYYRRKMFEGDDGEQQKLLQLADLMQNIINTSSDMIFVKDTELRMLFANETFAGAVGKRPEDLYGKTDIENGWDAGSVNGDPSKNIRGFKNDDLEALRGNVVHNLSDPVNVNGVIRYFDTSKMPLHDKNGQIIGVLGVARDVTDREYLKREQDKHIEFQTIVTSLTTQFINLPFDHLDSSTNQLLQKAGEFIGANRCYIYHFPPDLETASMVYEWCSPGTPSEINRETEVSTKAFKEVFAAFEPGKPDFLRSLSDLPASRASEKSILLERGIKSRLTIPLFRNGRLLGSMGFHWMQSEVHWNDTIIDLLKILAEIYLNLLERSEYEQQLRFQANLLQNVSDAIISIDMDRMITSWNNGAEELYGYSVNDVLGQSFDEIIKPEYPYTGQLNIRAELIQNGRWAGEIIHHHADQTPIDVLGSVSLLTDANGGASGFVAVNHDIRERKQMEQQRLQITVQQNRIGLLEDIINDLSHDIKTPLASIKLNLHLLQKKPSQQEDYIRRMDQRIDHLTRLVDDILTMSKLNEGATLDFHLLELTKIVESQGRLFEEAAKNKQIQLDVECASGLPEFHGNEVAVGRVIGNLIENAINYTPSGNLVRVEVYEQNNDLVCKVSDTGIGINSSDLPRIFERFYRADKARSTSQGGTGLGLAIAKKIIDLHGGSIEVQSTSDVGTTFTCFFPKSDADTG